jgi:hypothetical protein
MYPFEIIIGETNIPYGANTRKKNSTQTTIDGAVVSLFLL